MCCLSLTLIACSWPVSKLKPTGHDGETAQPLEGRLKRQRPQHCGVCNPYSTCAGPVSRPTIDGLEICLTDFRHRVQVLRRPTPGFRADYALPTDMQPMLSQNPVVKIWPVSWTVGFLAIRSVAEKGSADIRAPPERRREIPWFHNLRVLGHAKCRNKVALDQPDSLTLEWGVLERVNTCFPLARPIGPTFLRVDDDNPDEMTQALRAI